MGDSTASQAAGLAGEALAEVPLPQLLGGIVDGLLHAQDRLDRHAAVNATQYVETPGGTMAMPPLWFAFKDVQIDLEMSASVAATLPSADGAANDRTFLCRLVNPASVSLFGYEASAALRISLRLGVMQTAPMPAPASDLPPG